MLIGSLLRCSLGIEQILLQPFIPNKQLLSCIGPLSSFDCMDASCATNRPWPIRHFVFHAVDIACDARCSSDKNATMVHSSDALPVVGHGDPLIFHHNYGSDGEPGR